MTFRENVPGQIRGFFFAPSGDDILSGTTAEKPKRTIPAAIASAQALVPPPSIANGAQVSQAQGGAHTDAIVLFDAIILEAPTTAIENSSAVSVALASNLSCRLQAVTNTLDAGICFKISGDNAVVLDASFSATDGIGGTVLLIEGDVDDVFIDISQIAIRGNNSTAVLVNSTSPSPIDMAFNTVSFEADNCTFYDHDPVNNTDITVINVSTLNKDTALNSTGYIVRRGTLIVEQEGTLNADVVLVVENGATMILNCPVVNGDIVVNAGGKLICYIQEYSGTITNNGIIDGNINNDIFGNENSQSTTIRIPSVITQGSTNTKIDITAGTGIIYDYVDPQAVLTQPISFGPFTDVDLTFVATEFFSWIAIDRNGAVNQFAPASYGPTERRDFITLGVVLHQVGVFNGFLSNYIAARETHAQLLDLMDILGVVRATNSLLPTPNANLTFDKASGFLLNPGSGNIQSNRSENTVFIAADAPASFSRFLGIAEVIEIGDTTLIDPNNFDDGTGTKAVIPGPNNATIQYIFQFPDDELLTVHYGQVVHMDISAALNAAGLEQPVIPSFTQRDANLIGRIVLKNGATNLTNAADAVFLPGAKFGVDFQG